MSSNVVECKEEARGTCGCEGTSLDVLRQVRDAYEDKLQRIQRSGRADKLKMEATTLRAWVNDLLSQNTLLVKAVEELELDCISRVQLAVRRNQEIASQAQAEALLRRRLARTENDLRGLLEVLRRLRELDYCSLEGIQFYDITESDIYGSLEWRQKKQQEGDSPTTLPDPITKINKHFALK